MKNKYRNNIRNRRRMKNREQQREENAPLKEARTQEEGTQSWVAVADGQSSQLEGGRTITRSKKEENREQRAQRKEVKVVVFRVLTYLGRRCTIQYKLFQFYYIFCCAAMTVVTFLGPPWLCQMKSATQLPLYGGLLHIHLGRYSTSCKLKTLLQMQI